MTTTDTRPLDTADTPYDNRYDNPYAPCDDDCGIRDVLDRLGDRWSVLLVVELAKGTRRFRELQRAVPGISQRMLSVTAKRLVRDGLVERTVHPTTPPQTDYRLTETGRSFSAAVKEAVAAARDRWDAEHRPPAATPPAPPAS
jgi:DNA-binding HxlR family transcriptional regulator